MHRPIISLDFFRNLSPTLDVSEFFLMSPARPTTPIVFSRSIDDMLNAQQKIDLSLDKRAFVEEAKTDEWQDLSAQAHILNAKRPHTIDIVPSLLVPYGAIDVRKDPIKPKKKRYADLFVRKLPRWLTWKRYGLKTRWFLYKKRYTFLSIALSFLFLSIPTLFYVKHNIEEGYNVLLSLKDAHNISEVRDDLTVARRNFERANFLFAPFSWIPFDMIDLAQRAGNWGLKMTRSLESVVRAIPAQSGSLSPQITLSKNPSLYFRSPPKDIFLLDSLGIDSPTDWIQNNPQMIEAVSDSWSQVAHIYSGVKWNSQYAQKMRKAGNILSELSHVLAEYQSWQEYWLQFLGSKTPQRYMVFNQNRDEIRANGGFPGSIISFTLYKWNILDYRSDDVYYYDWNLYPHQEFPPPGIALMTDNFGLRDVNYYPDFLNTLEKANEFVERSGEPTLTTALAIHQGMIEDMLAEIGPVSVQGIPIAFDANNFSSLMSVIVEGRINGEKTPKDVLFQFIEAFGKKIVETKKIPEVFAVLQKYWDDGEILIASRDADLQNFISKYTKPLPWKQDSHNWIYPVFTSLSGNKSDRYIERTIQVDTKKLWNCNFKNTVRLTLSHTYNQDHDRKIQSYMDTFEIQDPKTREKMQFIQWKWENKVYIRFFVPKWSKLIESKKMETVHKKENSIFTTTLVTPVGKKSTKTFSYQVNIPQCNKDMTDLDVVRQPWLHNLSIQ